jgi:hypothetical protein
VPNKLARNVVSFKHLGILSTNSKWCHYLIQRCSHLIEISIAILIAHNLNFKAAEYLIVEDSWIGSAECTRQIMSPV